ncbi:hypothetical protein DCCM_3266 [Desulfocucumis palustris]|uniref:Phage tail fibre protein N-terminal domain-containing protein n=1 Tax=Desulfocucumis palustris TaxID=1898651 RepID=A0A2L2XDQ3_9FIRM|nr:phage tail protein [Desulfocucumis palustris]GBF34154.1 hypothetical protein DCCM_3266 [Desulfocucumis palustris]
MANAVTTNTYKEKMAKAMVGDAPLPEITQMAFGTGGHAPGDPFTPVPPVATATALEAEIPDSRKNIDGYSFPTATTARVTCTLAKPDLNGNVLTEIALIDADGDVAVIKTFAGKAKDNETSLIFDHDIEL